MLCVFEMAAVTEIVAELRDVAELDAVVEIDLDPLAVQLHVPSADSVGLALVLRDCLIVVVPDAVAEELRVEDVLGVADRVDDLEDSPVGAAVLVRVEV